MYHIYILRSRDLPSSQILFELDRSRQPLKTDHLKTCESPVIDFIFSYCASPEEQSL
jgi:hypothetical protein